MKYTDFVIRARDWNRGTFNVEVTNSPFDQTRHAEQVTVDVDILDRALSKVERKQISPRKLIELGKSLTSLLMPPSIRSMFERSLASLTNEEGLRIRLVLTDPQIANLPWEYMHMSLDDKEKGLNGYLAMNPKVSIVRHEPLPAASNDLGSASLPVKVAVGFASPNQSDQLDLETERAYVESALDDLEHIEIAQLEEHLTVRRLESLLHGIDIFHFAGHGTFGRSAKIEGARDLVPQYDASTGGTSGAGEGAIVLEDEQGNNTLYPAELLGLTLRNAGVKVAVLGACETGRRDGVNVWSGIAPALMKAGIPGVVAMQYKIYDDNAKEFARGFYESLAKGLTLDEAVISGRLAIVNAAGRETPEWGVPVLYMRSSDGVVFPQLTENPSLEGQRTVIRQRIGNIYGKVVGVEIDGSTGGSYNVKQVIDKVGENGEVYGAIITNTKGGRRSKK